MKTDPLESIMTLREWHDYTAHFSLKSYRESLQRKLSALDVIGMTEGSVTPEKLRLVAIIDKLADRVLFGGEEKPRSLEEYSDEELGAEIQRRELLRLEAERKAARICGNCRHVFQIPEIADKSFCGARTSVSRGITRNYSVMPEQKACVKFCSRHES